MEMEVDLITSRLYLEMEMEVDLMDDPVVKLNVHMVYLNLHMDDVYIETLNPQHYYKFQYPTVVQSCVQKEEAFYLCHKKHNLMLKCEVNIKDMVANIFESTQTNNKV
jgi:hypothetical protein